MGSIMIENMRRIAMKIAVLAAFSCSVWATEYGPRPGTRMPDFTLRDQSAQPHSLKSLLGPQGAVILFYRSADW
jgi:hypothetical protein